MKTIIIFFAIIFINNSGMAQWNLLYNQGCYNRSVFFVSANEGHIAVYCNDGNPYCFGYGFVMTTHDGGNTWYGDDGYGCGLNAIYYPSPDTGYTSCYYHTLNGKTYALKTTSGTSWTQYTVTTNFVQWVWLSLFFLDNLTGYAVGSGIYKTNNGGLSWTELSPGLNVGSIMSIYFTNYQTGYIVSNLSEMKGYILKTTNGGINWVIQDSCVNGPLRSVVFVNDSTGFVVGGSTYGIICRTTNGGITWIKESFQDIFLSGFKSVCFSDLFTGYAVGNRGLIAKTIDGGYSWHKQFSPTGWDLNGVTFPASDTGYIVGDEGVIMKTVNGGGYFVGEPDDFDDKSKITITPNPAGGFITLRPLYAGTLNITDMRGNLLLTREMSASDYSLVDITSLSRGIYLFKLVSRNGVHTGKFVKQ